MDKNNLDYLFQNGSEKPTVMADSVKIGDETYGYVGLKTKGNYTLDHTYNDNVANDRFSFSINFGKYITKEKYGEDQNFHGCDKISFNNFYFDKSMLKEYFALKLLNEMGLPAPQYGLAKVYINGKFYGVYSMIENMQKSILKRYLSVGGKALSDYLVKPTHTNMQYDENMDSYLTKAGTYDLGKDITTDKNGLSQAKRVLAEQSGLWENNEDTLTKVKNELPRVFTWQKKLTLLSQGKDSKGNKIDVNSDEYIKELEQVMDVEEVVKYFATHSFLVQNDNMFVTQQNFGLYVDKDGKSMLLPWDYDLSFGCYYPSTAEATANLNIDQMYKEDMGGEFGEECKGCYVITVSSNNKPVLVHADKTPLTDPQELYSGCYGRAIINFYVYDTQGNKGISAGLNGIMKLYDGEPLGGGVVTDSDWDDGWEDEDDNDDLLG